LKFAYLSPQYLGSEGALHTFDLAALAGRVTGIDKVSLTGNNHLDISARFLAENGSVSPLKVSGNGNDLVSLVGEIGTWTQGANTVDSGTTYKVYSASYGGSSQSVWVANSITVTYLSSVGSQDFSSSTSAQLFKGTAGADTQLGGSNSDMFYLNNLSGGADSVSGGGSSDSFYNGDETTPANDTIDGGASTDSLYYFAASQPINVQITSASANSMNGTITGSTVGIDTFSNIEFLYMGRGNDTFSMNGSIANIQWVAGMTGNDTLTLGGGSESVIEYDFFGAGADVIDLGAGDDNLRAGAESVVGNDIYNGGSGTDTVYYSFSGNQDITFTYTGNAVETTGVNFTAVGTGIGTDTLNGFEALYGGNGNDLMDFSASATRAMTLSGGYGNDTILSGATADSVSDFGAAGAGSDSINLGAGNDTVYAGAEGSNTHDTFVGGAGTDLLSYFSGIAMTLTATGVTSGGEVTGTVVDARNNLDDFQGFESFEGSSLSDLLDFHAVIGVNITVTAGLGNDTLLGGGGNDNLTGAAGQDTYRWALINASNGNGGNGLDTISGFFSDKNNTLAASEDILDLKALFSGQTITTANLASYVQMTGSTLQVDRDGVGSTYAMTDLVTLTGVTLTNADLQNLLTAGQLVLQ
jgi:Ca2+-binding RTX toxin-like protein